MRLLAGLLLASLLGTAPAFAQSAVPFTVTEVSRQFDAAGNLKSETRFLYAMNRDGSIVSMDLDPSAGGVRQIIDAATGENIVVDPNSRSAAISRYTLPVQSANACAERFHHIAGASVSVESAGEMQGVAVQRVSVTVPNGQSMEIYLAPSLGCHMLRTETKLNGVVLQTQTAEELTLGDPDPALFRIPEGYAMSKASLSSPQR